MSKQDTTEYDILLQMLTEVISADIASSPSEKGGDVFGEVA